MNDEWESRICTHEDKFTFFEWNEESQGESKESIAQLITQSPDTRPEAEKVMISLIRGSSIAKRISVVRSLSGSTIRLSRRAIKRANPDLDNRELNLKFISYHYGEKLARHLREYMEARGL